MSEQPNTLSTAGGSEAQEPERLWESRQIRWSAASGLLLAVGFLSGLADGPAWVVTGVYAAATFAGARFFAVEAIEELIEERAIGIELLMSVAAAVAAGLGLWGEAATLAFLYSISEALEAYTEGRTRRAIRALIDLAPKQVTLLAQGGEERLIPAEELRVGDRFLARPGERIATDGVVREGTSSVDQAPVTGESIPVEKEPESQVFAGTLNHQGALVIEATATHRDNTLAKIVHLVTEAQEEKGRAQRFMERFSARYSPSVLAAGVLIAVAGGAVSGEGTVWLVRAATFIVAAAPCALVISIPVSYVAAIGRAGREGILVKGGVVLEDLATVRVAALDKTGTLTVGRPRLAHVAPVAGRDRAEVLRLAASLERTSEHPLAQAVVQAAQKEGLRLERAEGFRALIGLGVEGRLDATGALLGSPALAREREISLDGLESVVEAMEDRGMTVAVLAVGGVAWAALGFSDTIREQAPRAVEELRRLGIERVIMLTGDHARTAQAIAARIGVDEVLAGLRPEDKARRIAELKERYGGVMMVGDGVNDAPALAAASVGVAMGTAGSDVALETADVALMADDLSKLVNAVRIARRTRSVVRQNLVLSFAVLAVLVPGALLGLLSLPLAVLGHELAEIAVIASGLRLARG